MAALSGDDYERLEFDFPVSAQALEYISLGAGEADVSASGVQPPRLPGSRAALSFSGGLDSLASDYLMAHENYLLFGTDYGGWFEREYNFLRSYPRVEFISSVDFRRKHYGGTVRRADYIAAPTLLIADYFDLQSLAAGTTLETNEETIFGRPFRANENAMLAAGVTDGTAIKGCTEFLTSKIVLQNEPQVVEDSLRSLAAEGSEKSFRKALSIEMARASLSGRDPSLENVTPPKGRVQFGTSIYVDFAFIVLATVFGAGELAPWVDFPDAVVAGVDTFDPGWIFSYHPIGMATLTEPQKQSLEIGLKNNEISVFTEDESANYDRFVAVLQNAQQEVAARTQDQPSN